MYNNSKACDSINELNYLKSCIKVSGGEITGLQNYKDNNDYCDEINLEQLLYCTNNDNNLNDR